MYKDKLPEIQAIIDEIEKQIQDTECVFRGEPKCYEQVSCGAFREFMNVEEKFTFPSEMSTNIPGLIVDTTNLEIPFMFTTSKEDIQKNQEEALRNLQRRIGEEHSTDPLSMAAILQHIGHGTYLLDFTKDYRIAMFFACRKEFDGDGRIILLRTDNEKYKMHDMFQKKELQLVEGRAAAQKSMLVDCPEFFVEEVDHYYVCKIPNNLKVPIMEYLKAKDIFEETMFPDYLGFIEKEKDRKESHKIFREGLELENRKNYDEAIQCYSKAINLRYDFAGAYKHRGYIWFMKNQLDRAEEDLTKSLYFDPDDMHTPYTVNGALALTEPGFAHFYRSVVYVKKGEKDKAIRDCSRAIELNPKHAEAYFNRGLIYAGKNKLDNAINDLSKGLNIKPDNPQGLSLRGKTYWRRGDIKEAMKDLSKAIEMNTEDSEILKLRGIGYCRKGKFDEAINDFNKSLIINSDDPEVLKNRAKLYCQKSQFDDAIIDINKVLELNPNDSEALKLLAIIQQKRSERKEN